MDYSIVVARYNEDLKWTKQYSNVIIYNKGGKLNDDEYKYISLKNVGREGHTYYTHIYENYDNLTDYVIFLQGRPTDHTAKLKSRIQKYTENNELDIDFAFLSDRVLDCSLGGCGHHRELDLKTAYNNLFDEKRKSNLFKFGAGAQFIVSKKQILKRPKEFYLKIIKMLEKEKNPTEGYIIERFHPLIFS